MGERRQPSGILVEHFFRRFFDNDTIQTDGDTVTTVVRAISIVAAPGLMLAFFLQNSYPARPLWGRIGDEYFFVLVSFVVMGAVAIFEWEMLFPDKLDFLILSPLPVRVAQVLGAKAIALAGFFGLFLVGCNLLGGLMLSLVSKDGFSRHLCAHSAAVALAGTFAALLYLGVGGLLLSVLGGAWFRRVLPVLQMASVMGLVLLLIHYTMYGNAMAALLGQPLRVARWMPPLWFLGVYEELLRGDAAPAFAGEMTRYALRGTAAAGAVALLTYPTAWSRMRRMAVEGTSQRRQEPWRWVGRLVHWAVRRPGERGVFHFVGQTIPRNSRYQVYLAMYGGTGLALAVACGVTLRANGSEIRLGLSERGLHAVMPLLLFWIIAGLRTAFAFPLTMQARWVFRITGVTVRECAAAARRWVLFCALTGMGLIVAVSMAAGWRGWRLMVQVGAGVCLSVLLTDAFFASLQSVPFTRPRMPGRTNFPLMLTLYVGVFPLLITGMVYAETRMEANPLWMLGLGVATAATHAGLGLMGRGKEEVEEEMEGYEGEFQVLGLS